jgi:AcrR family transcriptional regulator
VSNRDLREVIVAAAAELVAEQGITSVAMAHVAERAQITRATLYKYFPDVRAMLDAWHERHVAANLDAIIAARDGGRSPRDRITRVLETYAELVYRQHSPELLAFAGDSEHTIRAYAKLTKLVRDLIADGPFRDDVPAGELASFCISALAAATRVGSAAAARRLARVAVQAIER